MTPPEFQNSVIEEPPPVTASAEQRGVRLTNAEIAAIRDAAAARFGVGVRVWLFGSRTDASRRGGDIDLYIEPAQSFDDLLSQERAFYADLQRTLGEQRIDLVVRPVGRPARPIDREAKQTGVRL